ncbi:hypothetical protein [Streptomyces cyaneofuscatus]|uniref:hypothetical protein n=1 Tax=Streptomyces cyaneofuscatus TaxID=66883 RepID=UPI0037F7EFE9
MSAQPIEPNPPDPFGVMSDNRLAVQSLIDRLGLPAPTIVARPEAVHVTLADVDDLGRWMHALGGEVRRGVEISGASLWTLHTQTPVRPDGSTVQIRAHVPVVSGEAVLAELRPGGDSRYCAADLGGGHTCHRRSGHNGDCEPTPDPPAVTL